MEGRTDSVRIKKLVKVGLSEGGGAQLNVLLKEGRGFCHECYCGKNIVSMRVLNRIYLFLA